jgi:hypothetical protein
MVLLGGWRYDDRRFVRMTLFEILQKLRARRLARYFRHHSVSARAAATSAQ